jgi:hypothetical protein
MSGFFSSEHTPEEAAYRSAQIAAGFGDPYAEDADAYKTFTEDDRGNWHEVRPPAATYPPGTPMITNKYETYPAVVLTPPSVVGGNRVLAWSEDRRRDGEYPGGVVLTVRDPEHGRGEYAIWGVCTKDAGRTWVIADSGSYPVEYTDAWHEFTRRAQLRPGTEF